MKCVKKIVLGMLMIMAIGVVITACGKDKNTTDNNNKPNTENTTKAYLTQKTAPDSQAA